MGLAIAFTALEVGLRALGNRAPAAILAERHDLGEVRKDPRWELTSRYGRRPSHAVDDMSEWRHGAIVRMGFIPAAVSDGVCAGSGSRPTGRDSATRARAADRRVGRLGDSFTDAMTIEDASAWPTLIEQTTGLAVQNYGTAGFGPQQELRVLTDYALAHHPKVVVLCYFAGTTSSKPRRSRLRAIERRIHKPDPGWPIKGGEPRRHVVRGQRVSRRAAVDLESRTRRSEDVDIREAPPQHAAAAGPRRGSTAACSQSRVNGQTVRWAFMPPYLNTLRMSEGELSARRGWTLTTARSARCATRHALPARSWS
jgi:hypothetical protein